MMHGLVGRGASTGGGWECRLNGIGFNCKGKMNENESANENKWYHFQ